MELYKLSALDTIEKLKSKEISPLDCIDSLIDRIEKIDKHINALPTLCIERAKDHAKKIMEKFHF